MAPRSIDRSKDDRQGSPGVTVSLAHDTLRAPDGLISLVSQVVESEGGTVGEISLVLADHETVTGLNQRHLRRNYDTDVLAFDLSDTRRGAPGGEDQSRIEGEIYIDIDTASERAPEFSTSYDDEVRRYAIHGTLHLLGYTDDNPGGEARMRDLENYYLSLQVPTHGMMNNEAGGISMTKEVTFRHFDSVPGLKNHALKSVDKLTRYYDGITSAHVVLDIEKNESEKKSAEISVGVFRQTLTASHIGDSHEEAINRCVSQLRRQILRYKGRLRAVDKDIHR